MSDKIEESLRLEHREGISRLVDDLSVKLAYAQDYEEAFKLLPLRKKYASESECIKMSETPKETFTIAEIKAYLMSQDSLGDIHYNLSAENIKKANEPKDEEE